MTHLVQICGTEMKLLLAVLICFGACVAARAPHDEAKAKGIFDDFEGFGNNFQNAFGNLNLGGALSNVDLFNVKDCRTDALRNYPLRRLANKRVYYFAQNDLKTWSQAQEECARLGMHLVSMETKFENSLVLDWVQDTAGLASGASVWTSLRDANLDPAEFVFRWDFGDRLPVNYPYWLVTPAELCGAILKGDNLALTGWQATACDTALPYICEARPKCEGLLKSTYRPYE